MPITPSYVEWVNICNIRNDRNSNCLAKRDKKPPMS